MQGKKHAIIGKKVLHYQIKEELGRGGMGIVYKAEDTKLKRTVAIKFLPYEIAASEEERERFKVEAQAAAALNHPNIATIHAIEEHDDEMFIVMEYIEGQELRDIVVEAHRNSSLPLPIEKVSGYAHQIAEGLRAAHRKNIVHRDIKSSNIMVTEEGQVKIMDFGLAKVAGEPHLTKNHSTLGTAAYMSPEQARGEHTDYRTDIWSFGVVLYEMATGKLPFQGDYDQAVIYAVLSDEHEPIGKLREDLPENFSRLVDQCLRKDREQRPASVDDILSVIKGESTASISTRRAPAGRRGGSIRIRIAATLAVVILVAMLVLWFRSPRPETHQKSIAVLPFQNLSPEGGYGYFADGITEDIQTQVSRIGDLRVIASLSTRRYRDTGKNPREIGEELDVSTLLTGSVRRSEQELRITCQLIDAHNGTQIWGQTFDRKLTDIFAIQKEVALAIANLLEAKILPGERESITTAPTENMNAYEHILKANEAIARYTKEDNEEAIEHYRAAIRLDPQFARAWAGLARSYVGRFSRYGFEYAWVDSALEISQRAIQLDPNSAEAHASAGISYAKKGWTEKALLAYQRALECNSNYYIAMANLGTAYKNHGQYDLALRWQKKAQTLVPTAYSGKVNIGVIYSYFGDYQQADEWFRSAIEQQPGAKQVLPKFRPYWIGYPACSQRCMTG